MGPTVACRTKSGLRNGHLRIPKRGRRSKQHGVAAVELAVMLPFLVSLLALSIFFGRIFWHYTVAQKAAHDAARYMSSVPMTDLHWSRIAATVNVAEQILDEEIGELTPGDSPVSASVRCDEWECDGLARPTTISVRVRMNMTDPLFGSLTQAITGQESLLITAIVHMAYTGR